MKKYFTLIIALAFASLPAGAKEIEVTTAGTLPELISDDEKYTITELTLTGELNGTDILYLREMAGSDYVGEATEGQLSVLDMSGASIVSGGDRYFTHFLYGDMHTIDAYVGDFMFYGCTSLTDFSMPVNATLIGMSAFYGCTGLVSADIPDPVTAIGESAYQNCTALRTVTIGSGVTSIVNPFYLCPSLERITVDTDNAAFADIDGVLMTKDGKTLVTYPNAKAAEYTIPDGIETIGSYAFGSCNGVRKVAFAGSVRTITLRAFDHCANLEEVDFVEGLNYIGPYAFYFCESLKAAELPNSLTVVDEYAFSACNNLAVLDLGEGVKTVADGAFADSNGFTEVTLPDNLTSLGNSVFARTTIETINFGTGLTVIPEYTFTDCTALNNVSIPACITEIGDGVFARCAALENIDLGEGVRTIGNDCFSSCGALKELVFPDNVENIGMGVFSNCMALERLVFSDGIKSLGSYLCSYCMALKSVELGDGLEVLSEGLFSGCTELENVVFGKNTKEIGSFAFMSCSKLKNINLPQSLEKIGDYAFSSCVLESVEIPAGVTSVGLGAFAYNYDLSDVSSYAVEPPSCGSMAFNMISESAVLHVPEGSKAAYEAAAEWQNFFDIQDDLAGVGRPAADGIRIQSCDGGIRVSGSEALPFVVYAVNGTMVAEGVADGTRTDLVPGIYVVKAGTMVQKVSVR